MRRQSAKKEARSGNVVSSMLSAEGNHAWRQVFKYVASKMQRCHIMSLFDGDSGDGGGGGEVYTNEDYSKHVAAKCVISSKILNLFIFVAASSKYCFEPKIYGVKCSQYKFVNN